MRDSVLAVRELLTAEVRDAAEAWFGRQKSAERLARVAWSVLTEPGDGVAGELIASLGAEDALEAAARATRRPADSVALADATARWRTRWDAGLVEAALRQGVRRDLQFVIPGDAGWCAATDDLGAHAPVGLWVRGNASVLGRGGASVGVVGARAATPYGELVTSDIASELAADGAIIISGAAYGVDGAAHRAALRTSSPTVAFVAGGVDRVYPAGHAEMLQRIAETGAIVAERPPGAAPTKWRFLARNRLIAAASTATVVIEAGVRSGSLNTANHAATLGRPLGAVPGPVTSSTSAGCHRLLREYGAVCITSPDDVRELLGLGVDNPLETRGDPELTRVSDALARRTPRSIAEIARLSGLAEGSVIGALGLLALSGAAVERNGGWVAG